MATTISLGKVKFEFKGDYAGGTTYHVDDIVVFENRKFIYTNSAPSAGNAPLIEDTNWQYDYLAKKRHADLTKLKLNFTYWDYFEDEASFGEYKGLWANNTTYNTGDVVTGSSGACYYAVRKTQSDDPKLNLYGSWNVLIEGGPIDHTRKIQRAVCENPIGWRGHPRYSLHANTGWSWNGNIPSNTYGANGQSELYNDAKCRCSGAYGGFIGSRWDGSIVRFNDNGHYFGNFPDDDHTAGISHKPQDFPLIANDYDTAALKTDPRHSGAKDMGYENPQGDNLDRFSLSPQTQPFLTDPFKNSLPRVVSITGSQGTFMFLYSDGTIHYVGYAGDGIGGHGHTSAAMAMSGATWRRNDFGGRKIVKLSFSGSNSGDDYYGRGHAIALDEEGEIWTWGEGAHGQLGYGPETGVDPSTGIGGRGSDYDSTEENKPILLPSVEYFGGHKIVDCWAVGGLDGTSWALDQMGRLWSWGCNDVGQLGHPTDSGTINSSFCAVPRNIGINWGTYNGIQKIIFQNQGAGSTATVHLLDGNGDLWAWGDNDSKQIPNGTTTASGTSVNISAAPDNYRMVNNAFQTATANSIVNIWSVGAAAGATVYLAMANGAVMSFGDGTNYKHGTGATTDISTPVDLPDISHCIHINSGGTDDGHSDFFINKDRVLFCNPDTDDGHALFDAANKNTNSFRSQRQGTSQFGVKEVPLPPSFQGKIRDVITSTEGSGGSSPSTRAYMVYVLDDEGRLAYAGSGAANLGSPGVADKYGLANHMYWGS